MCVKKCSKCGEVKAIELFTMSNGKPRGVCKACKTAYAKKRIEAMKIGAWHGQFVFDDLLARWVSDHARKPNGGRPRTIRAYTCAGVRTKDGKEFEDGEFLVIQGSERERFVSPKFGHPMVVYQSESGNELSMVRHLDERLAA